MSIEKNQGGNVDVFESQKMKEIANFKTKIFIIGQICIKIKPKSIICLR